MQHIGNYNSTTNLKLINNIQTRQRLTFKGLQQNNFSRQSTNNNSIPIYVALKQAWGNNAVSPDLDRIETNIFSIVSLEVFFVLFLIALVASLIHKTNFKSSSE